MNILDRYLIKKFLFVLLFASLAFVAIFIVVDLIEHLDRFLDSKAPVSRTIVYYAYYVPYIVILTLPVNMLLSSLFSLGSMSKYNELVAAMSSGVSLFRIILPLLVLAFFISIVAGLLGETLVPEANRSRIDIYEHEIRNLPRQPLGIVTKVSVQDHDERQVSIDQYNIRTQRATKVNIVWREDNRIVERWDARNMTWDTTRTAWLMKNVTKRRFEGNSEKISRQDTVWLTQTRVSPESLVDLDRKPEEMTYFELKSFIDKINDLGTNPRKWLVDLYSKVAYPFASFIIVLFGAPMASQKRRSGYTVGFALALMISFAYFGFIQSGKALGYSGTLDPILAAWIANIIFGIGGLLVMIFNRR